MIRAVIFDMFETLITHYHSPLYFGAQMAADAGIAEEKFQALWRPTEYDRTIGKLTLEEVVESILRENQCYSEELVNKIVKKRIETKQDCFRQLHSEIIPMLKKLKEKGILIGLISNCFSEEAEVIRRSVLFPYFDAAILSYEQGVQKPDEEIYKREMRRLCRTAKKENIPLEINFLGIRDNRAYPNPLFWQVVGEEGCSVVFGFDAHEPKAAYDDKSLEIAKQIVLDNNLKVIKTPKLIDPKKAL